MYTAMGSALPRIDYYINHNAFSSYCHQSCTFVVGTSSKSTISCMLPLPAVASRSGWWPRLWSTASPSPRHRHIAWQRHGRSSRARWFTVARGLSFARLEVPTGIVTIPARHPRHAFVETLLAAGRPLRSGECTSVYFNVVRSTCGG